MPLLRPLRRVADRARGARRLDPHARTSVNETLLLAGQFDRLLALERPAPGEVAHAGNRVIALGLSGRFDEAQQLLAEMRKTNNVPVFRVFADFLDAWLERRPDRMLFDTSVFQGLTIQDDPEAMFNQGWLFCDVGDYQRGIESLGRSVAKGYCPAPTLAASRHFDSIRHDPAFRTILAQAEAERDAARRAFYEAGGDRLLGLSATVGA